MYLNFKARNFANFSVILTTTSLDKPSSMQSLHLLYHRKTTMFHFLWPYLCVYFFFPVITTFLAEAKVVWFGSSGHNITQIQVGSIERAPVMHLKYDQTIYGKITFLPSNVFFNAIHSFHIFLSQRNYRAGLLISLPSSNWTILYFLHTTSFVSFLFNLPLHKLTRRNLQLIASFHRGSRPLYHSWRGNTWKTNK